MKLKELTFVVAALAMLLSGCSGAQPDTGNALDIYISVSGRDSGKGTSRSPFATMERAMEEIRSKREGLEPGNIVVHMAEGEYVRSTSLNITADDSGTPENPIVWKAEGEAIISGGITLSADKFSAASGAIAERFPQEALAHIRAVDLGAMGLVEDDWGKIYASGAYSTASKYDGDTTGPIACELFCNGERMTLARYPDEGKWIKIRRVTEQGDTGDFAGVGNPDWNGLRNPEPGRFSVNKVTGDELSSWLNMDGVWMFGYFYYDWADMTTPVAGYDAENGILSPLYASVYGYKSGARFYLFNAPEALDQPGEWYLDRDNGILYFYPPENSADGEMTLSLMTDDLIKIDGASFVAFDGVTLRCTRGSAVEARGNNLSFAGCKIYDAAYNGITLTGLDNSVTGCEIYHIGSSAVQINGGDIPTLAPSGCKVSNNVIHDWSEVQRTYCSAVGLSGVGTVVANNEMYSAPHLAILYQGNDFVIEYNDIHDVCTETSDGGAIYAGRNWIWRGTTIRYNYIHDIRSKVGSPMAVYFDDALCGQTVFGNIFENIRGSGLLIGGGRDINVANNIFISVTSPIVYDQRAWDGYFSSGWFAHMVQPEHTTLWDSIDSVPYTDELWQKKYPSLAATTFDRADSSADNFICNPGGSSIFNNIVFSFGTTKFELADRVRKSGMLGDNLFLDSGSDVRFAAYSEAGIEVFADLSAFSELAGLENIPVGSMGAVSDIEK